MPIDVPFSPRFVLEADKLLWSQFNYQQDQILTEASMSNVFSNERFDKDVDRTLFRIDKNKNESFYPPEVKIPNNPQKAEICFSTVENDSKRGENPVNLSKEEVRALFAITSSTSGEFLQGGFVNAHTMMIFTGFFMPFSVIPKKRGEDRDYAISRSKDNPNDLNLNNYSARYEVDIQGNPEVDSKAVKKIQEQGIQLIGFSYNYHITKVNDDEFFSKIDNDKYKFQIHETLWQDVLIPIAMNQLNTINKFTNGDLVQFIPCLCDPEFSKAFIKRLEAESPEIQRTASKLIALCYDNRPKDINRIIATSSPTIAELISTSKAVVALEGQCEKYEDKLQEIIRDKETDDNLKKLANDKITELTKFKNTIFKNDALADSDKLKAFTKAFETNKSKFENGAVASEEKFITNISQITGVTLSSTLPRPAALQKQQGEIISQLVELKDYIESLPEVKNSQLPR